jgi:hypothetical protein
LGCCWCWCRCSCWCRCWRWCLNQCLGRAPGGSTLASEFWARGLMSRDFGTTKAKRPNMTRTYYLYSKTLVFMMPRAPTDQYFGNIENVKVKESGYILNIQGANPRHNMGIYHWRHGNTTQCSLYNTASGI